MMRDLLTKIKKKIREKRIFLERWIIKTKIKWGFSKNELMYRSEYYRCLAETMSQRRD